jgi:sugar lactone lactonase YvrE
MCVDKNNNLWVCSYGNNNIIVYIGGDFNNSRILSLETNSNPFDITTDSKGFAIVSVSGNALPFVSSSILKLELNQNDQLVKVFNIDIGVKLLGIDVDSNDNIFVASSIESSVYKIDPYGNVLNKISGNQIVNPWSCTVDSNDNVWINNFSAPINTDIYGVCCYTNNGIPITPPTGYTLPSGGTQVLLATGEPLSGYNSAPCFSPLMRQTASAIDCAGNLWVLNNWKPYIPQDTENPGGDSIVVFLGIGNNIK